jgi:hypothetical protein
MKIDYEESRIGGKTIRVPAARINNATVIVTGKWVKTAAVKDEDVFEGNAIDDPAAFVAQLAESGLRADIFAFAQKPAETKPKYGYHMEWDNAAIVSVKSYADWWERLSQDTRRNVRRAAKSGVTIKTVPFDDDLVRGITEIYNETPIRQGRRFYHYGKGFEAVKEETGTYLERSTFIAAYYHDALIGFCKLIYADENANIIHILSKNEHMDKRPSNALVAKAVEICAERGLPYLTYCKYVYGKNDRSPLTEFKRRNGFEKVLYPRYYVPLTAKGKIVLALNLHHGLSNLLPRRLVAFLLDLRAKFLQIASRKAAVTAESSS